VRTLHIGLRVADREASVAFYRALGYELVGTVAETPIGHLTMLKLPQDEFVTLELVSAPDAAPGLSHLVVATGSLDDTIATLDVRGIHAENTSPPDPSSIRTSRLTDPDGNEIELVQWPAGHPAGMTAGDFGPVDEDRQR
jgi:lactoylglutathione lyase